MIGFDDVVQEIRRQLNDPRALVEVLGLAEGMKPNGRRGVKILCPWHNERHPSCSVTLGADGTVMVVCFACDVKGDAYHLVAAARGLDIKTQFRRVLEEAALLAGVELKDGSKPIRRRPRPAVARPAPVEAPNYPPQDEVEMFWDACLPVNRTQINPDQRDLDVCFFLSRKGFYPPGLAALDIVRVTSLDVRTWPSWWPVSWTSTWRLVTRAYNAKGECVSLHARAVRDVDPKTRWPYEHAASGLFFANELGLKLLRRDDDRPDKVYLAEGLTDTVAAAMTVADVDRSIGVLGISAGTASAYRDLRLSPMVRKAILTHSDPAGDHYAEQVKAIFPEAVRLKFPARIGDPFIVVT